MLTSKKKRKKKKKRRRSPNTLSFKIFFTSFHILKLLYDMLTSLSMILVTSISMYTIKQLLNY